MLPIIWSCIAVRAEFQSLRRSMASHRSGSTAVCHPFCWSLSVLGRQGFAFWTRRVEAGWVWAMTGWTLRHASGKRCAHQRSPVPVQVRPHGRGRTSAWRGRRRDRRRPRTVVGGASVSCEDHPQHEPGKCCRSSRAAMILSALKVRRMWRRAWRSICFPRWAEDPYEGMMTQRLAQSLDLSQALPRRRRRATWGLSGADPTRSA
jgi:hypothetical protein